MRNFLVIGLALLILAPAVEAGRRKPKAGKIADGVFTDSRYNYKLSVHENWSARIGKDKEKVRIAMTQRNYGTPGDFVNAPSYAKVPRICVYVDTTSLGVHTFLDSLMSDEFKSKQKSEILKEFEFLQTSEISDGPLLPKGRSRLEVGEESGLLFKGQAKYRQSVQTSASSLGGKIVKNSFGGAIAIVKRDNTVFLIHLICEWEFFSSVLTEAMSMVNSMEWIESALDKE